MRDIIFRGKDVIGKRNQILTYLLEKEEWQ